MAVRPGGTAFAQINSRLPVEIYERIDYARDKANKLRRERGEEGTVSKNAIVVAALDDSLPTIPDPQA